jgi:hypothetical protein
MKTNVSFIHNEYFEYLLGDPSYLGEKMFVMHRFEKHKLAIGHDVDEVSVFNKMHVNFKMRVEWGVEVCKWGD